MALTSNNPRKLPGGVVLVVLCVLSLGLMTIWSYEGQNGPLHKTKAGFEVITMPLQTAGSIISTPIRALGEFIDNSTTSAATVEEMKKELEELQSQAIRTEEYRQENQRLRDMLALMDAYSLEAVGARVISTNSDSWNKVITINKGSAAGMAVGMPVMSANGLIGQIESVSLYSSQVRLIIDQESGIAVFLQSNRTEGILSGSVDGVLTLDFIPKTVPVQPGDTVITSGAGGVFPKGIPIGEVATVSFNPADLYQTITVKTFSRVSAYEEVLVIIGNEAEIVPQQGGTGQSGAGE